jgi:SAM-dependent methyltransferase
MADRTRARQLAAEFNRVGDPTGWFEKLYKEAEAGASEVPWADLRPNSNLLNFWSSNPIDGPGKRALVVGCGLGDDAEQLAAWSFQTTAFDISPTAIRGAQKRFPRSDVNYVVADALQTPRDWATAFDFVLEIYTVQVLLAPLREMLIANLAQLLRPGGEILVIARGRDETDPHGEMPWPVTRDELQGFVRAGLVEVSFEDYPDPESPEVRRFRVLYRRPR